MQFSVILEPVDDALDVTSWQSTAKRAALHIHTTHEQSPEPKYTKTLNK